MRSLVTFVSIASILWAVPLQAQPFSPAQQRRACRGDAMRLCWRFIPNRAAITQCMLAKHDQLSPNCMQVFDAGMRMNR